MELDREIHRLERGPDWGTRLAMRMMLTERRPPLEKESTSVRASLAEMPPTLNDVQLKQQKMEALRGEGEVWELTRKCHPFSSLDLSTWKGVSECSFRSLCLALGGTLETVDISRTETTDGMLEIFAPRLFSLRTINMASCHQLTNLGVRALAKYCKGTLTSVDLSDCRGMNDEAVAYLGGAFGFGSCCALLQSLSLADCKRISDAALSALAMGCRRLRYLNLSGCEKISTRGVNNIARGCSKMAVLNLHHCGRVHDGSLVSLSKHCPGLMSLNVALAGRLTDSGVAALGRGCPSLQALNIAGAREVTERGICCLAQNCHGLHTLNITGCVEVSLGGLHGLICGIGDSFVQEAKTFFGFLPCRNLIERRMEEAQMAIENRAANVIQAQWRDHQQRLVVTRRLAHARAEAAAFTVQAAYYGWRKRVARWHQKLIERQERAAVMVQRVYHGHRVRQSTKTMWQERRALMANGPRAIPFQALFRGFLARRDDLLVRPTIEGLLEDREQELRHAAAVGLQARVRAWIGLEQCAVWGEVMRQRMRDRDLSSQRIQRSAWCYLARRWLSRLRMERQVERRATVALQSFWRGCLGRQMGSTVRSEVAQIKRARHRTAIKIQAAFRGNRGRGHWRRAHRRWKRHTRAATAIQKVFRGSRVMAWGDIHLNKVAQHVFLRQELEYQERLEGGRARYQRLIEEANRDSCSSEEEQVSADVTEQVKDRPSVQNRDIVFRLVFKEWKPSDKDKSLAFAESLLGMRVWLTRPTSAGGLSVQGQLTRLNQKRRKHRLEFDCGGHEWVDVKDNQDKLLVWTGGAWVQLRNLIDPDVAKARRKEDALSKKRQANQHLFDREARWEKITDEDTGMMTRYFDPQTGEVLVALEDAESWSMERDDTGDVIFVHQETKASSEVVYDDPRFEGGRGEERERAKLHCLQQVRFSRYLCDQLCEHRRKYEKGSLGAKERKKFLEALASGKKALKIASAIATARVVFRKRELEGNDELQAAILLVKYMNDLKAWAREELEAYALHKRRFLTGGTESTLG
ncbi:unnamed protein product [Ascophyllum nodosum]